MQRKIYFSINNRGLQIMEVGKPPWVVANVLDCGIEVSEFVLQSRYYVHFRTNTFGKDMNSTPLILPAMG